MIYLGEEIELFEDEIKTNDVLLRFAEIHRRFNIERKPFVTDFYVDEFKRQNISLNDEEIESLRDYFENEYRDAGSELDKLKSGYYKEVKIR